MAKRTFTKYPQKYVSAYTKPSYKNANFERFNKYANDEMPKGKVLVVSEDNGVQSANGYYGTTKFGDIFGGHSYYYLLTTDGELYSSISRSRWPLAVEALEEAFEEGRFFKKDFRDHWIDYNLDKYEADI